MLGAVHHCAAAMRALMLQLPRLEKRNDCAFTIRALHRFLAAVGGKPVASSAARIRRFNPDGLALAAHHRRTVLDG